jgi:hypothetical protein
MTAALSDTYVNDVSPLEALLAQLGSRVTRAPEKVQTPRVLPLGWPEVDAILPDAGLPHGVVELSSPHVLGGATSVALAAVRAAQQRDARAWCAWIDPEGTLYAPGVRMAGVDLARLLVVRPPRSELGRVAVKVAAARACDVIVIDADAIPILGGASSARSVSPSRAAQTFSRRSKGRGPIRDEVLVRKLALLAEEGKITIVLLTDALARRAAPWPVALRLELLRAPGTLSLRVAKDRYCRVSLVKTKVPYASRPQLAAFVHSSPLSSSKVR